jgi:hypothetical protein
VEVKSATFLLLGVKEIFIMKENSVAHLLWSKSVQMYSQPTTSMGSISADGKYLRK